MLPHAGLDRPAAEARDMAKSRKPSNPSPSDDDGSWSISDPDQKIPGLDKSLRELLEDPVARAELQAQIPGIDLSGLFQPGGSLNSDALGDDDFDNEDWSDDDSEISEGFQTLGLRVDLLDEQNSGLYWCFKVPEWLTLGALHRVLSTILGRPNSLPYSYEFPYESFGLEDEGRNHPDSTTLRRAFAEWNQGFYGSGETVKIPNSESLARRWGFLVRCVRKFTYCRGAAELLRLEPFPPADSATPEEYVRRLKANELARSEPFEEIERRLQRYVDPSASRLGPYHTSKMSLPSLLFAALQARDEPMTLAELTYRAYASDVEAEVTLSTVKRATKKAPFVAEADGRVTLDRESAAYSKAVSALKKALAPAGPRLMMRRFTSPMLLVDGQPSDIVLLVDDQEGLVHGHQACRPSAGVQPMLDAIDMALESFPQAVAVVTDDPVARQGMLDVAGRETDFQFSVDEPLDPFLAMERDLAGPGYSHPAGLSQAELVAFSEAAFQFYLLAPWALLSDADIFEIGGLAPKPLIVSILGQGREVYGLSLYEGVESFRRFAEGDRSSYVAFMDFNEASATHQLRQQIRKAGGKLLDNDTCAYAFGVGQPSPVGHYRLLTEVMTLLCQVVDCKGGVKDGTVELTDSGGRPVRVTFPVDLESASESTPASSQKLGRNDPCWCGSGKKFKKCHG